MRSASVRTLCLLWISRVHSLSLFPPSLLLLLLAIDSLFISVPLPPRWYSGSPGHLVSLLSENSCRLRLI